MEDKKTYLVFNDSSEHEYTIEVEQVDDGERITAKRSNSAIWHEHAKGEKILSLTDNGNRVEFDRNLKKIEYGDLDVLRIMLTFRTEIDTHLPNKLKHRIIEDKTIFLV
jgi:hypothetical protein